MRENSKTFGRIKENEQKDAFQIEDGIEFQIEKKKFLFFL